MDKTGFTYKRLGEVSFYPNKRILLTEITSQQYVGVETLVKNRGGISFSDELPNTENAIEYIEEDILIGNIRPYLKKIWKADRKGGASGDVVNIRILPDWKPLINSSYLFMALSSDKFFEYDNANTHGAKMPRGDKKAISEYLIPIPSFELQTSIVSELNSINDSILLLHEQVKDLDVLAQALFYDMFGDPYANPKQWDSVKLGTIAEPTIGLTYKPENVSSTEEGTIVLRSSNIQESELTFEDIVRVNVPIKEDKFVKDGDILMCSRNGSFKLVGKVAMIKGLPERMSYGAFMTIIRSDYNPYLFAYFKTPAFREHMNLGKTSTVNQVTVNMLKNICLPLPPHDLQRDFASKISIIDEAKNACRSQIAEMQTLLAARMQYWFD